jgi:hypothetical protein
MGLVAAVGLTTIGMMLDLRREREHGSVVSERMSAPAPELDQAAPRYLVRTTQGSLVRIKTVRPASSVRITTSATANVPRIDTSSLANFFPGRGVAVIHHDPEPPRAVFF